MPDQLTFKIRPFQKTDAKACVKLINLNQKDLGDLYSEQSLIETSLHSKFWVAEKNHTIVGMIGFSNLKNGIGMTVSLSVHPEYKKQGIGRRLLQAAKNYARKQGFRKVLALIHAQNKPMMILAIKEDFIPEGSLKNHFRTGQDVIYFSFFCNGN
ncbi:hypothetical protein B5M47_00865 [candidate division CPR3 bacterium 4484_211]|uniref:N-acetyltransferase domain-containing protein n=1 Tax=candidate division CPR3 bacterium 4484_211 TaxID=1968527 RepID=A0A1W9NZ30_UNCC3|nr:MAG: hypothetical protein B5M47_00865 [candidate division CPR3 bacterium 4484_211]